jgi:hypothetical protein
MMPSFKFKKNFLVALIIIALILLTANIILTRNWSDSGNNQIAVDEKELSQRFKNILYEFGIEEKLIKETKSVDKRSNREISNFKVQVPKDLSIPEILIDISQSFRKDSLTLNSVEKIKGGKSTLTLKLGASTLLQAVFDYAKNYSRNKGFIAFILYDVDPGNKSTTLLIESPTKLNFLIRPDTKHIQYLEFITKNSQQFSVLIDDEIGEQKYQLGPSFSEQRVVTVVKTLVTDYQKAVCFIVDDNSDFYKSANYEILKREFSKRNIKLFRTSDFESLNFDDTILPTFDEKIESLETGESIIFLLNEESYLALNPEINRYKKKGYRVITSSLIL